MHTLKRMLAAIGIALGAFIVIAIVALMIIGRPDAAVAQHYGISFSSQQAKDLKLDPHETYLALLEDLQVKRLRLGAYWTTIEPLQGRFDFSDLDWQMDQAASHNAEVILAVGQKLPRWPECFVPTWANGQMQQQRRDAVLNMLKTVVMRYRDHKELMMWQLENEPYVDWFGDCSGVDLVLLTQERDLIKSLSNKPILVTDSGELSGWSQAAHLGDIFGTTMYRVTWNQWFGYGRFPWPAFVYRAKARLNGLNPRDVLISELQAEPWPPGQLIVDTSIDEQMKSMSLDQFNANVSFAKSSGFGDTYLWGAEWWYWMKQNGHPEFWEAARKLFQQ